MSPITRTTVSLARKSILLAHASSVPVSANAQHARALTSSGSGQSVSSLSSATFLGASLAARKFGASGSERKRSLQEDASAEVHGFWKNVLQNRQAAIEAELKAANQVREVCARHFTPLPNANSIDPSANFWIFRNMTQLPINFFQYLRSVMKPEFHLCKTLWTGLEPHHDHPSSPIPCQGGCIKALHCFLFFSDFFWTALVFPFFPSFFLFPDCFFCAWG